MGVFTKGILGGFSGKVGTVVGAYWRGKNIMRSLPTPSKKDPTPLQLAQRVRFSTVVKFLRPLKPMLSQWFGHMQNSMSPYNQAVSYHIREALMMEAEEYVIDYSKVLISKGDLPGLQSPTASPAAGDVLNLQWEDNTDQGLAKPDDELSVVLYAPNGKMYQMYFQEATRSAESAGLDVPPFFSGQEVQVWATFVSADGKHPATSSYLGEVSLP